MFIKIYFCVLPFWANFNKLIQIPIKTCYSLFVDTIQTIQLHTIIIEHREPKTISVSYWSVQREMFYCMYQRTTYCKSIFLTTIIAKKFMFQSSILVFSVNPIINYMSLSVHSRPLLVFEKRRCFMLYRNRTSERALTLTRCKFCNLKSYLEYLKSRLLKVLT